MRGERGGKGGEVRGGVVKEVGECREGKRRKQRVANDKRRGKAEEEEERKEEGRGR